MKTESAEKKALCFIASYKVSSLTYNKTFYMLLKSMKRRFFFTYQNRVNTGHRTRLGLKTNLPEYFKIICMFKVFFVGQGVKSITVYLNTYP